MFSRFESLWDSAGGDGALTPVGVARPEDDYDALMDAWFRERQESTECRLYLDEAGRLLRQIQDSQQVPLRLRRRAKNLLLAMRAVRDDGKKDSIDED